MRLRRNSTGISQRPQSKPGGGDTRLVVVGFAYAFSTVALYPLLKFVIEVLLVLPLSFLVGFVLRKLPLANRML